MDTRTLLQSIKTVAMLGVSDKAHRPSNQVFAWMLAQGYDMIPVNPDPQVREIHGQPVVRSLSHVDRPIDMVQVFRRSEHFYAAAEAAIAAGAKVLWGQLGVQDARAEDLARQAGLIVVVDKCPKIELQRGAGA